jgi:hypothetical protein
MDSPQELAGIDEEQETEASGLPSSNPSVLEADYANIRANLVEGSTPRRVMAAPALRVGLPRASGRTSGRLVAPAADGLGAAPAPFATTSPAPRAPKVQIQLHLTSISVHRCVRDEANACCCVRDVPRACCYVRDVPHACCCRCYLLVVLACCYLLVAFVFRMLYYAELIIQTDLAYFHVQTGFDMLFVAFVINQLMVWLQLQLMCCFFLVDV